MSRFIAVTGPGAALLLLSLSLAAIPAHAARAARRHCYPEQPAKAWTDLRVIRSCTERGEHFTTTVTSATGRVVVLVPGLAEYRRMFEDPQRTIDPQLDPSQLVLYIDGRPLPRFAGTLPDAGHSHVTFDFADLAYRNGAHPESLSAWKLLLSDGIRDRRMTLSVGFPTRGPLPSEVDDFEVDAISTKWLTVWFGLAAFLLGLLFVAGTSTDMLRVPGASPLAAPAPAASPAIPVAQPRKAYSLARVQMAAWFFAALLAFVFIYLVTGTLDSLTPTVLALMGISAATGLAASVVDNRGAVPGATAPTSHGFFTDILQEGDGTSLPRVQMVVWTVVLLFIFGRAIYHTLVMPEFSGTLLGLMGISSGTYVGFKLPGGNP